MRLMPRPNDGPGDECTHGLALGCAPPALQAADWVRVHGRGQLFAQPCQGTHLEHADGARAAPHAARDLFMRE